MRIVLRTICHECQRVGCGFSLRYRVLLLFGQFGLVALERHNRLVHTLPVVYVLALAPLLLERRLTLAHRHLVVEVPLCVALVLLVLLVLHRRVVAELVVLRHIVAAVLLVLCVLLSLQSAFLLLLLLQCLDGAVDGCVAFALAHLGERLQRVLQVYGVGVRHEVVQNLRAVRQLFVVLALLVEHTDSLTVAALRVVVALLVPVYVAQLQQQHALLYARACSLSRSALVGDDSLRGVVLRQVDVADGVVYLVEIVLVLVRACHALQSANHLLRLTGRHHLRHGDARVELQFVRRVELHHVLECLCCLHVVAQCRLHLSHEKPLAGALLASHLVLDDVAQVGDGFLVFARVHVVVGVGVVPLLARRPVNGVALHVAYHVLGVVEPTLLDVALGEPRSRLGVDGGLRLVETSHVVERSRCLVERTLVELRTTHEHPCLPEERVVLAAREPLQVLRRLLALLRPLRSALYAVQLDGLLTLLDGAVVVRLAYLSAALVAHGVERYNLGEVVFVALLFLQRGVNIR